MLDHTAVRSDTATRGRPLRIATVYAKKPFDDFKGWSMATVRWLRISEAFASMGHRVDLISDTALPELARPNLSTVAWADVDWGDYDVVKTLFHQGFDRLRNAGGEDHPFIVSKLGSVVGPEDTSGVYFFGEHRERLFETQQRMAKRSRHVAILTESSLRLWADHFGDERLLLVPTGVDRDIPTPGPDPFGKRRGTAVALYLGNIYEGEAQRQVNILWQERLNDLGRRLRDQNVRLFFAGSGQTDLLDPRSVTSLGPVDNDAAWDLQFHADVGLALAQGPIQDNESSKIYGYLRAGLPVVAERSIPNSGQVEEAGLGVVAPFGEPQTLADTVIEVARREWDRSAGPRYVLAHHTWEDRAAIYDAIFTRELVP